MDVYANDLGIKIVVPKPKEKGHASITYIPK